MTNRANLIPELIPDRIDRVLRELKSELWERKENLLVRMGPLNVPPISCAEAQEQSFRDVKPGTCVCEADAEKYGEEYNHNCPWSQRWFRVSVPAVEPGEEGRRVLFWHCHGEATVYRDGTPWAGIDAGHEYCILPDHACELWIDGGMWQTAIWTARQTEFAPDEKGFRFDGAWIALRNQTAWDAWHDLSVLDELIRHLIKAEGCELTPFGRQASFDKLHPRGRRLLRQVNDACDLLDNQGVDAFAAALKQIYHANPPGEELVRVAACGHSHLDLVWLWPREVGIRKGVHTCSTQLRLLEQYPDFQYMMTQPWLFQEIQKQEPELMAGIREHVKNGRWEFTGGMLVESDTTLPCLEGLIRSIAHGQEAFRDLRNGSHSMTCFLPDCFGFSAQFPQLLALGGIDSFFTTKMSWNRITKMPHDSFRWQALDGSEVLAHLRVVRMGEGLSIESGMNAQKDYRQADVHDEVLDYFGLGDGGGGPQEVDCERMIRYSKLAGASSYRYTTVESFFERLSEIRGSLPVFAGEMYLEYHRGCYTTQSPMKQAFRRAEAALQVHEALRAVTGAGALPSEAWRGVIYAQFHDTIPGSSIPPVPRQLIPELKAGAEEQLKAAGALLQGSGDCVSVFNATGYTRTVLVRLDGIAAARSGTNELPVQHKDGDTLVQVELPPFSSRAIETRPGTTMPTSSRETDTLDNGLVRAVFGEEGQLISLTTAGAGLLTEPARFMLHQDIPAKFEAWDIDQVSTYAGTEVTFIGKMKITESGPLRWTAEAVLELGNESSATVQYILEKDSPILQVVLDIDWQEKRKLLRFEAQTAYRGSHAWFGCPGGSVKRPQLPGYQQAEMMWEVPGSRWAAVTDDAANGGLACITESSYGFSARNGLLGLSLLRSPWAPPIGMECAGRGVDHGKHTIRFALGPFQSTHDDSPNTPALADVLYSPVLQASGSTVLDTPYRVTGGGTLINSWLLPTDDGYVMRFYESMGTPGTATLTFKRKPESIEVVDLLGRPLERLDLNNNKATLPYSAYQILSVRVMTGD